MLLMQQTRVIYLIYHRNCPEKVFSDPLFSKSWPLSSVVLLTKKSLCFFSLLHSTLESTTINHDRAMFLPELMNRANYIGTVFQNHHKYHVSITENILVGSVENRPSSLRSQCWKMRLFERFSNTLYVYGGRTEQRLTTLDERNRCESKIKHVPSDYIARGTDHLILSLSSTYFIT